MQDPTNDDEEEDVHSARTVPPPAGGDAYADATVVREVPADILAAIEPPEEKLGALTAQAPRLVAPLRTLVVDASGLPSVLFEDEDEEEDSGGAEEESVPSSSPLLMPPAPELVPAATATAGATTRGGLSRHWIIGLVLAAALVMWTLAALK